MYSRTGVDQTLRMARILDTYVETTSVKCSSDSLKYLVYLCKFSQEGFTVVRPLNRENIECWSSSKKVDEIYANSLIATVEFIGKVIILGIDADIDDRTIKIGTKLILESKNKRHPIGEINKIHKFTKDIPYEKIFPIMKVTQYTILYRKFVEKSVRALIKSKFPPAPLINTHNFVEEDMPAFFSSKFPPIRLLNVDELLKEEARNQKGELVQGKAKFRNSLGNTYEGYFDGGVLTKGKIIFSGDTFLEIDCRSNNGILDGEGKLTVLGFVYTGKIAYGHFNAYIIVTPDGDWFQQLDKYTSLGRGKITFPTGEIYEGSFSGGILSNGKVTYPGGNFLNGKFGRDGYHGEGKFSSIDGGVVEGEFVNGHLSKGKRTLPKINARKPFKPQGFFGGIGAIFFSSETINSVLEIIDSRSNREVMTLHSSSSSSICSSSSSTFEESSTRNEFNALLNRAISTSSDQSKIIDAPLIECSGYTETGQFESGRLSQGTMIAPNGIWITRPEGEFFEDKKMIMTGIIEVKDKQFLLQSFDHKCDVDSESSQDSWVFSKTDKRLERRYRTSTVNDRIEEKIIGYLEGTTSLDDIEITADNAFTILKIAKIIDYLIREQEFLTSSIQNSTYSIRQALLKVSPIRATTSQFYTNSINPEDYNTLEYLVNPLNWMTERIGKQAKIIIDYTILSRSLSERMRKVVVVTRGNTGVGKSYWIKKSLMQHLLPKYLKTHLHEHDDFVHGVLNPDHIKATLKKIDRHSLLNSQVYLEGRILFERFLEILTKHPLGVMGAVIDTRLLTLTEFKEALAFSQSRDAKLEIIDVEAPIWCSILSVLNREPYGENPCVPFEVIKDGYKRARANRGEFIHASTCEKVNYSLYQLAPNGEYIPIVRKGEDDDCPVVLSSSIFDECLRVPSEEEMDHIANIRITEELIQSLEMPRNTDILRQWIGYTVKDALEMHSKGEIPCSVAQG